MKFQIDHDLHIHSYISPCAGYDPRQNPEAILDYGIANDFSLLCVTDHIWDRNVGSVEGNPWLKRGLDVERAKRILPLPQSEKCKFLLGIEVDMDYLGNLGLSPQNYDAFDFIVLAPSHLHLKNFTRDTQAMGTSAAEMKTYYQKRLLQLLNMDLPFHKCGLAHFTACLQCDEGKFAALDQFTDEEFAEIFRLAAKRGLGIELNAEGFPEAGKEQESMLRPYRIAKKMGCKFYLGSDAHQPEDFADKKAQLQRITEQLNLTEDDKLPLVKTAKARQ